MRLALDESNYHMKKSLPDRTKSAPHFGGVQRKVNRFHFDHAQNRKWKSIDFFSYFSNNICKYI